MNPEARLAPRESSPLANGDAPELAPLPVVRRTLAAGLPAPERKMSASQSPTEGSLSAAELRQKWAAGELSRLVQTVKRPPDGPEEQLRLQEPVAYGWHSARRLAGKYWIDRFWF